MYLHQRSVGHEPYKGILREQVDSLLQAISQMTQLVLVSTGIDNEDEGGRAANRLCCRKKKRK